MGRRVLTSVGIVVGLIAASFVAAAAYTALKSPLQTKPNSNLAPDNCSPGPCANVNGYKIWISKVRIENDVVRMTVKFQNSSSSTHASPEDLQLIDTGRRSSLMVTDAAAFWRLDREGRNRLIDVLRGVGIKALVTQDAPAELPQD